MPRLAQRQGRPSTALLASRIKAERERLGLSQRDVAQRLAIAPASYRQMEHVVTLQYGVLLALVKIGMNPRVLAEELFAEAEAEPATTPTAAPPAPTPGPASERPGRPRRTPATPPARRE